MALISWFAWVPPSAVASVEDAGEPVVVAGAGSTRPRTDGGSDSEFSLRLPDGAACPGDSATDGYRVQSFMVPMTVDAGSIGFDGLGPAPNTYGDWATFRQPLYDTTTRPLASALTAVAIVPGQPGPIVNIPSFSFAVYGPGELPPGRYRVGIACTLANQPVRYWDTELAVTSAPDDEPAGITWKLATGGGPGGGPNRVPGATAVVVVVGGLITAAGVSARRRLRPRVPIDSTEES